MSVVIVVVVVLSLTLIIQTLEMSHYVLKFIKSCGTHVLIFFYILRQEGKKFMDKLSVI